MTTKSLLSSGAAASCHATRSERRRAGRALGSREHGRSGVVGFVLVLACAACSGSDGEDGRPGGGLPPGDETPGLVVVIEAIRGASGPGGAVQTGDGLAVDYVLTERDGTPVETADLARAAIMVSGPTFSYQRVVASQADVVARSSRLGAGRYRYTFAERFPAAYLPPLNDSPDLTEGELTGQPLLAGTYTVGLEVRRDFAAEEGVRSDAGNATLDFLYGSASELQPRAVVSAQACLRCHTELSAHGGNRTELANCLLCHTAGAEDRNVAHVEGGTPGVSVEFQVMIHKIHAGAALPSVVGMTTKADGSRDYAVAGQPYRLVGFGDRVHDYSHVQFPVWPSSAAPMPRDTGWVAGTPEAAKEDRVRSGPVDCAQCHGDPDGSGPLPAPAQGDLAYRQPSRRACASCHDDWLPHLPYVANEQPMPPQLDDSACIRCHAVSGNPLDVVDAHLHPLRNPLVAPGIRFDLTGPAGNLDPGDKPVVSFTLTDDHGNAIAPSALARLEVAVSGPTSNPNRILVADFPTAALSGPGPGYTTALPERIQVERVGVSTGTLQTFVTQRSPHWAVAGADTRVFLRPVPGPPGSSSLLAAPAAARQNHIDVLPGAGASFARDDWVVLEDGVAGKEEYLRIAWVDGDRLWFTASGDPAWPPALRTAHASGVAVAEVTLAPVAPSGWSLDAGSGTVTESSEFGDGIVLVTYTTDFLVPALFPGALNDSPDLDASVGDWGGLPLVPGTYTVGLWGSRATSVSVLGEVTPYVEASSPAVAHFLVGGATTLEPNERIESSARCEACHTDLQAHGGERRGFATCMLCHGNAGTEDLPRYVAAQAPATPGRSVDFRAFVHGLHHGQRLEMPYVVVGQSSAPYPENYALHDYGSVGFPAMPRGTAECAVCHGDVVAWRDPPRRSHPSAGPVLAWQSACMTCHDTRAALGHARANTSSGEEACAACHGPGAEHEVTEAHSGR